VSLKGNKVQESSCSCRRAKLLPTMAIQQQTPLKHQEHSVLKNNHGRIAQGLEKQRVH